MSTHDWPGMLSMSVLPAMIISACALLALAFYGRLSVVVARLRGFQREMLQEQKELPHEGQMERSQLLEMLKTQTDSVIRRAKLIRLTLFFSADGNHSSRSVLFNIGIFLVCAFYGAACRRTFCTRIVIDVGWSDHSNGRVA